MHSKVPMLDSRRQWMSHKNAKETHLIKVQPHYNVWLFCELMHCFQEVHMANVWQVTSQEKLTMALTAVYENVQAFLCKSCCFFGEVIKGYGRGQRLLPHRWWCLRVEAPGLKQTGWSSVKSAGTETPPSRDCGPSDHVTPVMQKKAQ